MLQTVTQQNLATTPGQGVPKDSESHPFRPWLKLRLGARDLDVERQVENWKLEGKATANVTMGIRLVAALAAGNLDAARQICPAIGLVLGAESQRPSRARSPLPESRSPDPEIPKFEGRKGEIARAISEVTGADLKVNGEAIDELAIRLILAGYGAVDVYTWRDSVWRTTWPGNKGDWPKLKDVAEGIGRKALPATVAGAATNTPSRATVQASVTPAALPAPAATPEPALDEATQARAEAICKVTRKVVGLHREKVEALAVELGDYGSFSADEILTWERRCWKATWPGSQSGSRPPTLEQLRERIGEVRDLPPEWDGYGGGIDDPDDEVDLESVPDLKPELKTGRGAIVWMMVLGQLQIQLNRSTYDTWLRHIKLVEYSHEEGRAPRFVATVPHHYAKDWIEAHLMASMSHTLSQCCYGDPPGTNYPAETIARIEIEVEEPVV